MCTAWHPGDDEGKPGFSFGSLWPSSWPVTPDHTESLPCLWLVVAAWAYIAVCTGVEGMSLF